MSEIKNKINTDHDHNKYTTTQKIAQANIRKFYYNISTSTFSKQKSYC